MSVPVVATMSVLFESDGATLFLVGIRMGGAARGATLSCLVPSVTALIAWPLLGQGVTVGVVASNPVIRTAVEEAVDDR